MSETIYVCTRWETEGIETLENGEITELRGKPVAWGTLQTAGKRDNPRKFTEGNFFTDLNDAINHANLLKVKKENAGVKLKKKGYFSKDVLKLPK